VARKRGGLAPNGSSLGAKKGGGVVVRGAWCDGGMGGVTSGAGYLSPRRFPRGAKGVATSGDGGVAPRPGGDGDPAAAELRPRGRAGIFVVNSLPPRGIYRRLRGCGLRRPPARNVAFRPGNGWEEEEGNESGPGPAR